MIESKYINSLLETYLTSKRVQDGELVIYENPDRSERQDIAILARKSQKGGSGPYVRIIADAKTKKVYVWDAYYAEHILGRTTIGLPPINPEQTPWMIYGTCTVRGSSFELYNCDSWPVFQNQKFFKEFLTYDWTWLSKYVNTKDFFDDTKRWIDIYKK